LSLASIVVAAEARKFLRRRHDAPAPAVEERPVGAPAA